MESGSHHRPCCRWSLHLPRLGLVGAKVQVPLGSFPRTLRLITDLYMLTASSSKTEVSGLVSLSRFVSTWVRF